MISQEVANQTSHLTLVTSNDYKLHKIKRSFIFENGKIYVVVNRNSQTIKNIRNGSEVQIVIGTRKITCKVEYITDFQKIFDYLKKEIKKLSGFYGNKYERTEAHLRVSAMNHILLQLTP